LLQGEDDAIPKIETPPKMSEVINLRMVAKQKKREAQARKAAENAAKHGRSKADRQAERAAIEAAARRLDGHKRSEP